jgi:hypothetical protein
MNEQLPVRPEDLPGVAQRIARAIGVEATVTLIQRRGGRRIFVPATAVPGQQLVGIIGIAAAQRLAELYGNDRVELPTRASVLRAMRDTRVREEHALGTLTVTAIADKFGLSRKHVQRILYGT